MFANTELTLKIGSTMQSCRHITRVHIEMQEFAQRGLEALKWWVGQYEVGGVAPLEERKKGRQSEEVCSANLQCQVVPCSHWHGMWTTPPWLGIGPDPA